MNSAEQKNLFDEITRRFDWDDQLGKAFEYAVGAPQPDKSRPRSIEVAKRVLESGSDRDTVIATLLSDPGLRERLDDKAVEAEFGNEIAKLTRGVNQLNTLKERMGQGTDAGGPPAPPVPDEHAGHDH